MSVINNINNSLLRLLYISCIIEIILFPQFENIYGCLILIINMNLSTIVLCKYSIIRKNYISFFILYFYTLCFSLLPLIATLIANVPLTNQFKVPYQTFTHHLIFQIILLISFVISKNIGKKNNYIRSFLLDNTNYFTPPSNKIIITLSCLGLCALIFTKILHIGLISKISGGIMLFTSGAICLIYGELYSGHKSRLNRRSILIFIASAFLIGIIANSRSSMLFLILILLLIIFTYKVLYNIYFRISIKKIICITIGYFILSGFVTDIATAMILVRNQRNKLSPKELFIETIDLVKNKELLYKLQTKYFADRDYILEKNKDSWSEEYTENIFLDRLCNLRVSDATLYYANKIGYNNDSMKEKFWNNLISNLPSPILELMGISHIKKSLEYSSGDLLYYLAEKDLSAIGGFRVCGYTGMGMATFGYWFYPISIIIITILFYILDGLILPLKNKTIVPICTLTLFYSFFYFFNNGDGIVRNISFILRSVVQSIIIYLFLIQLIKKIYGIFK